MGILKYLLTGTLLLMCPVFLFAQNDTVKWMPKVGGVIRAKYEYNSSTGKSRFEVRNARFQVSGNVTKTFNYKAEVDLSDEGQIKMLDAYVRFIPLKGLSFTLGQMKIPFSTDNLRSPGNLNFSNRSFIAKRICKDLRDIGFMATWEAPWQVPLILSAGLFNGHGINTSNWAEELNYGFRIEAGPWKGVGASASYYSGKVSGINSDMVNAGVNYRYKNFYADAEYAQKHVYDTSGHYTSNALFAYVLYEIHLKNGILRNIVPALRYDFFTPRLSDRLIEPGRITTGLTFGFHKITWADIRLSYEKYMYRSLPNRDDKATIELIARF